jgi:hypothetical protein
MATTAMPASAATAAPSVTAALQAPAAQDAPWGLAYHQIAAGLNQWEKGYTAERAADAAHAAAARAAKAAQAAAAKLAASGNPKAIAQGMLDADGQGSQFSCLNQLWYHESGWQVSAQNAGSGAYGIPQALPASQMASAGPDWQTNPATQIKWGLSYIQQRYGSPCGAWSHELSAGWY